MREGVLVGAAGGIVCLGGGADGAGYGGEHDEEGHAFREEVVEVQGALEFGSEGASPG